MVRPRPRRGERRIDAAIDHLAEYGFPKPQIRRVINDLLKLYGREGWVFLEEGQYRVVLEKLLEEQAQPQEDQQPEAAVEEEASLENDTQVSQENHMQVSLENRMQFSGVQNVGHKKNICKSQSALQPQASHDSSPSLKPVLSSPPAAQAVLARPVRPPCHGWISEESDTESELEDGEVLPDLPSPRESLPFKRKRPSRWDVGPN